MTSNIEPIHKSRAEETRLTPKLAAILGFQEYLVVNLARNPMPMHIYVNHLFGDKALDSRPTSHIYYKDHMGREYIIIYNLYSTRETRLERKINEASQSDIYILPVLIKSVNENGIVYGDFFRFDRDLSKLERTLQNMLGQLYYYDSSKKRIEVFKFDCNGAANYGLEPIEEFESFTIVPSQSKNLKFAKLEHRQGK